MQDFKVSRPQDLMRSAWNYEPESNLEPVVSEMLKLWHLLFFDAFESG
jgi:hypothetical protein